MIRQVVICLAISAFLGHSAADDEPPKGEDPRHRLTLFTDARIVHTQPLNSEKPENLWLTEFFRPWVDSVRKMEDAIKGLTTTTESSISDKSYIKTYQSANDTVEDDRLINELSTATPQASAAPTHDGDGSSSSSEDSDEAINFSHKQSAATNRNRVEPIRLPFFTSHEDLPAGPARRRYNGEVRTRQPPVDEIDGVVSSKSSEFIRR